MKRSRAPYAPAAGFRTPATKNAAVSCATRSRRVAVLCAAGWCLTGCGRADDRRAGGAVTETFLRAVEQHDGARACAQLSDGAVQALEHDEGKSCERAAQGLDLSPSSVTQTQVFGTGAKVDLADGHSAFLELTRRGWRLSAAGCKPEPNDHPLPGEGEARCPAGA